MSESIFHVHFWLIQKISRITVAYAGATFQIVYINGIKKYRRTTSTFAETTIQYPLKSRRNFSRKPTKLSLSISQTPKLPSIFQPTSKEARNPITTPHLQLSNPILFPITTLRVYRSRSHFPHSPRSHNIHSSLHHNTYARTHANARERVQGDNVVQPRQ